MRHNGCNVPSINSTTVNVAKCVTVRWVLTAVLTIMSLVLSDSASSEQTLVLNDPTSPPLTNESGTGFYNVIATEAFRRSDLILELIKLPAERGLKNANAGIDDGDLSRIAGLERAYPNLVRVPEKIFDMNFVAFAMDPRITIEGWQSLRPYSVGFIKGWKIFENNIPAETNVTLVDGPEQLFTMLEKGRVDIILYSRVIGLAFVRQRNMAQVKDLSPPLATRQMFIYLHKKHSHLVGAIADALANMKA